VQLASKDLLALIRVMHHHTVLVWPTLHAYMLPHLPAVVPSLPHFAQRPKHARSLRTCLPCPAFPSPLFPQSPDSLSGVTQGSGLQNLFINLLGVALFAGLYVTDSRGAKQRVQQRKTIREAQIRSGDREVFVNEAGETMSRLEEVRAHTALQWIQYNMFNVAAACSCCFTEARHCARYSLPLDMTFSLAHTPWLRAGYGSRHI